jgi:hypothetical protein
MKKKAFFSGLVLSAVLTIVSSCEKTKETDIVTIEGIYVGSFSKSNSLKSVSQDDLGEHDGWAEVTMMGENLIQVHCYGDKIDTTFVLNYYAHHDSILVCLTGEDFEGEYGHMLGGGHISGGMMGDMGDEETEWMHHMSDEHDEGDKHFGGFDMAEGSFSYSFKMMDGTSHYFLKFHGVKE